MIALVSHTLMIELEGLGPTRVDIIRSSRRRSLALRVDETRVQVLAPSRAPDRHIIRLVQDKSRWVAKKLAEQSSIPRYQPKTFEGGEHYLYLGQPYELHICRGAKKDIELEDSHITLTLGAGEQNPNIGAWLERFFRQQAHEIFSARTRKYADLMGLRHRSLRVRFYKSQWGNCSTKGDLKFNWRLIMAPIEVVDYVVVHELSHIRHHNHSRAFWGQVEDTMPDYKTHRAWLRKFGGTLRMD